MLSKTIPVGVYIVLGFLVVGIFLYFMFRKKPDTTTEDVQKGADDELAEIRKEDPAIKQTYSNITYVQWADQIYHAVEGMGTDEDSVFQVFYQLRNKVDWVMLKKAFGVRDEMTLNAWIRNDFNVAQINKLNNELRRIKVKERL